MNKVALVVFAESESHSDLARVVNALEVAKEFKEAAMKLNSSSMAAESLLRWRLPTPKTNVTACMLPCRIRSAACALFAPKPSACMKKRKR